MGWARNVQQQQQQQQQQQWRVRQRVQRPASPPLSPHTHNTRTPFCHAHRHALAGEVHSLEIRALFQRQLRARQGRKSGGRERGRGRGAHTEGACVRRDSRARAHLCTTRIPAPPHALTTPRPRPPPPPPLTCTSAGQSRRTVRSQRHWLSCSPWRVGEERVAQRSASHSSSLSRRREGQPGSSSAAREGGQGRGGAGALLSVWWWWWQGVCVRVHGERVWGACPGRAATPPRPPTAHRTFADGRRAAGPRAQRLEHAVLERGALGEVELCQRSALQAHNLERRQPCPRQPLHRVAGQRHAAQRLRGRQPRGQGLECDAVQAGAADLQLLQGARTAARQEASGVG